MASHRLAEHRSIALHRAVAERLRADPSVLGAARERVRLWRSEGQVAPFYVHAWERALDGGLVPLLRLLVDEGEYARSLRQVTPFAGALSPRERWRIWREAGKSHEVGEGGRP